MKLRNDLLARFKHDVEKLMNKVIKIQKETTEICVEAQALMEEFIEIIDKNEDEEKID